MARLKISSMWCLGAAYVLIVGSGEGGSLVSACESYYVVIGISISIVGILIPT